MKLVLSMGVSLKERNLGWMHDVDLHLMGRNTYRPTAS
jgi:hypothetical protein